MRANLLRIIADQRGITNAIVLTHNIDFVFLQSVVMRSFRKSGNPTLTIFADSDQAAQSYSHQAPVLDSIGIRYRVVAVPSPPNFCFHPKAVLLSSPEKATLLVGSGNLTFGGWRENAECWVQFDSNEDGTARFAAFHQYLNAVTALLPMPEVVEPEVDEAFDPVSKIWAKDMEPPGGLFGRPGTNESLFAAILETVGNEPVRRLTICSPYFDEEGRALLDSADRVTPGTTRLLVQPRRSGLRVAAAEAVAPVVELEPSDFIRDDNGTEHSAFMHAKLLAFEREGSVDLFVGSANCSRAALMIPGVGNGELMAHVRIEPDEFQTETLGELIPVNDTDLGLTDSAPDEPNGDDRGASLTPLAASFEQGTLIVAYRSGSGVILTGCRADDELVNFTIEPGQRIRVELSHPPNQVLLEGTIISRTIQSRPIWVDHEVSLRSTAGQRNVGLALGSQVRPGVWSIKAWAEIADVFGRHLKYMPGQSGQRTLVHGSTPKKKEDLKPELTAGDIFTGTYSLVGVAVGGEAQDRQSNVFSLQQLLLRWFGLGSTVPDLEAGNEIEAAEEGEESEGEEAVDRKESIPKPSEKKQTETQDVTDRDRRRAHRLLEALGDALSHPDFLRNRPPALLAGDLKIASAILRSALREGWVEAEQFAFQSLRIWKAMFFTSEEDPTQGWIEWRDRSNDDAQFFREALSSPELTAALLGWFLAIVDTTASIETAEIQLAAALAVGRLPWLWAGNSEDVSRELSELINLTGTDKQRTPVGLGEAESRCRQLLRYGRALKEVSDILGNTSFSEFRKRISQPDVKTGELLWQGRLGFCVALTASSREKSEKVDVVCLQDKGDRTQIQAPFTVPVRALLNEGLVQATDPELVAELTDHLQEFVDTLAKGYSTWG